ncbi:MAG: hypothetical protein CMJ18_28270 [Phycisphaeraceae bacterium]|nr:hypothetical protein [Phycisphaeraceae bacterium]
MILEKIAFLVGVIGLPMGAGYALRRRLLAADPGRAVACGVWSRHLKLLCMCFVGPPVIASSMIRRPLTGPNVMTMAILGVLCLVIGAVVSRAYVAARRLPDPQAGALMAATSMPNLVSFGGLFVFAFWGTDGLQQMYLFLLLEHVIFYCIFYPWFGTYGPRPPEGSLLGRLRIHPVTMMPLFASLFGLACNVVLFEVHGADGPPAWTQRFNALCVPLMVAVMSFAVGLVMRPSRVAHYREACVFVSVTGFLVRPSIMLLTALACAAAGWIDDLAVRVAVLLSAMPVAFNALIAAGIYELDVDLVNSCWIVTSVLTVPVVVLLYVLLV